MCVEVLAAEKLVQKGVVPIGAEECAAGRSVGDEEVVNDRGQHGVFALSLGAARQGGW